MFAISAFYKVFKDPIELSYYEQARETFQPRNLGEAKVYGLEIEFRKNLNNFFNANINASLIESKQTYGQVETNLRTLALRDGETLTGSRQLQGQSPYLINASLDFNNQNGTRAGL